MEYASEIQEIFDATDVEETQTVKPMALAIMQMSLPEPIFRVMNRRFGMDGKAPMSVEDVALRYGLPTGMINSLLHAGVNTIGEISKGIDPIE
jgi:hypothetical protein